MLWKYKLKILVQKPDLDLFMTEISCYLNNKYIKYTKPRYENIEEINLDIYSEDTNLIF